MATNIQPIVLVIDPDALTLMGLSATLHHQGLEVHGARTPLAAARAARDLALDLVIVDGWIDDSQGRQTLERLRELPHLVDLPCIFLWDSGLLQTSMPISSFHLNKPLDLEALATLVKRALWMPHLTHQPMTVPSCKFLHNRTVQA
ncbi:MAG: response regulator [Pirellulaceae bacterium]|nr:response regulator [Pirellulaceae bacterium]